MTTPGQGGTRQCGRRLSPNVAASSGHLRGRVMATGGFSTRSCLSLNASVAPTLSISLEHPEQTTVPPCWTIQSPSSAVVTSSLLRPQSEHWPFADSSRVITPTVPTSSLVNGGWWSTPAQMCSTGRRDANVSWTWQNGLVEGPSRPAAGAVPARATLLLSSLDRDHRTPDLPDAEAALLSDGDPVPYGTDHLDIAWAPKDHHGCFSEAGRPDAHAAALLIGVEADGVQAPGVGLGGVMVDPVAAWTRHRCSSGPGDD